MKQPKGHGLVIKRPVPGDYIMGGFSKLAGEVIKPDGDWLPHIPTFEHQAPRFETNSCASQGTANAFEILHKFIYGTEPNVSDRFIAKESGTDPNVGNDPAEVAHFFRKNWSPKEETWPMDGVATREEYYAPYRTCSTRWRRPTRARTTSAMSTCSIQPPSTAQKHERRASCACPSRSFLTMTASTTGLPAGETIIGSSTSMAILDS